MWFNFTKNYQVSSQGHWGPLRGHTIIASHFSNFFLFVIQRSLKIRQTIKRQITEVPSENKGRMFRICKCGERNMSSVQSFSHVWLFATSWIAAHQASLSITDSRSSPKLMSIESVMPSSHLILCHPLLLLPPIPPSIRVFTMSQLFAWGGQSIGVSALASVLPKNMSWI